MEKPNQIGNWHALGDRKLQRKTRKVVDPQWKSSPGDVCAVAPLGSLVAILSDKIEDIRRHGNPAACMLCIFNGASCFLITSVPWSVRLESLVSLQWSDTLLLAAVFRNSCVRVFSSHGDLIHHFFLYFEDGKHKGTDLNPLVVKLFTWGGGVIYCSVETKKLYVQRGFEELDYIYSDIGDYAYSIKALGVIPSAEWKKTIIVISTVEGSFFLYMEDIMKCKDPDAFIRALRPLDLDRDVAYDQFVACPYAAPGASSIYFALCNKESGDLASLRWRNGAIERVWSSNLEGYNRLHIGGDGVLVLEEEKCLTFTLGNHADKTRLPIEPICISSEVGGGIRVYTGKTMEIYQIVSRSLEKIFVPGSFDPAAVLVKTHELFNKGDVKACETLRMIRKDISEAVETCLAAAESSWDLSLTTHLLNAALLGRYVSSSQNDPREEVSLDESMLEAVTNVMSSTESTIISVENDLELEAAHSKVNRCSIAMGHFKDAMDYCDRYCKALSMLRVANALREHKCEIITNVSQLLCLGSQALVIILAALRCHLLAIRIAAFLGINKKAVLLNWVRTRVKLGGYMTDGELVEVITKTLRNYAGIVVPYSDIAAAVAKEKRETLALALLDRERSMAKKFRVMCQWNALKKAAAIASDACNTLFAAYVIIKIQGDNQLDKVIEISNGNTFVRDIFIKYCKLNNDNKKLQVYYERTNDLFNAGINAVNQALEIIKDEPKEPRSKSSMQQIMSHFSGINNDASQDVTHWLKFASDFFSAIVTAKGVHKPEVVESASVWKETISQQQELIRVQTELEAAPELNNAKLIGKSLMATLYILYKHDMTKRADSIAAKFKIHFNQHFRCRIAAFYEVQNINELVKMSSSKTAQAEQNAIKTGKGPIDMVIDALVSLGATSSVESLVATLKPQHQQQWKEKLKKRSSNNSYDDNSSLFTKLSKHFWH